MFSPYAEWEIDVPRETGNPFDVDAKAVFTHTETGEVRETGLFYTGDGSYAFRFSGVEAGDWTFETVSDRAELDGYFGRVQVEADPDARGFVVASGTKFAQQRGDGSLEALLPNLVMIDGRLKNFLDNPQAIQDVIDNFVVQHGFTGFHLPPLGGQLFDIDSSTPNTGSQIDGSQGFNPDPRSFAALEQIIAAAHDAGVVVHLWPWGDAQRDQSPDDLPGGENGDVHQRMIEYMADRLGPLPGWTLGYGYDSNEWTSPRDGAEAQAHFDAQTDFDHLTSVRSEGPNRGTDHSDDTDWHANQDFADYEHWKPDYDVYVAAFEAEYQGEALDLPVMSGDRFRVRNGDGLQDWSEEETVDTLWISTMAGGAANIWGNVIDPRTGQNTNGEAGSFDYSQDAQDQISTWNTFFLGNERFALDSERANQLTGGADNGQYALISDETGQIVIYAEDTNRVTLNLAQLASDPDWSGRVQVTAVNTEDAYREIDLGTRALTDQSLTLAFQADWAIAIETL